MTLIDSHCHLDNEQFDADRDAVIERALAAGVETMVAIGTGDGPPDLEAGIRLADRYPCFYATVGVHPHDAAKATPETFDAARELLAASQSGRARRDRPRLSLRFFPARDPARRVLEQMRIARDARKPIVIHTREAWDDTIALLARALGARRTRRHHALFFGRPRGSPAGARNRILLELRRHRDVSQSRSRFRRPHAWLPRIAS